MFHVKQARNRSNWLDPACGRDEDWTRAHLGKDVLMRIRRRDRDPSQPETEAEETQFEEPEPEDEPEVSEADEGASAPQPAAQIEADLPPEATHEAAIPFEAADAVITEAEPVEPPVDPISEPLSPERPASTSTDPETEVRAIPPLPTNPV